MEAAFRGWGGKQQMRLFAQAHWLVGLLAVAISFAAFPQIAAAQVTANVSVFGPQTFVRTTGDPNQYNVTFNLPSWVISPYDLHIVNGDPNGNDRVSGISCATIVLNGTQVAAPSDFNQNVATVDKSVTLQSGINTLQVTLASKPGSYLTINILGTNGDNTPPQIGIVAPAANSYINTATPSFEITYADPVGAGEPGASGVNTSTLQIMLDGVDRTSLFAIRVGDASATVPANLALSAGSHTLNVSINDNAGNTGQESSQFTIDLVPPQIEITQPAAGSYLNTTTPTIGVQYSDVDGVNLSSLKILINNADMTSLFTKTNAGATLSLGAANALPQGANQIVAQIQDLAGNQSSASLSFNVDTTPPTISVVQPTAGSYSASGTVNFMLQFSDDQAVDPTSVQMEVDGTPVILTISGGIATGTVSGLADGSHTVQASVKDKAGNPGTTQASFYVDSTRPSIQVSIAAPTGFVNTPSPAVTVQYSDHVGVNTNSLQISVNGTDGTSLFTVGSNSATLAAGQLNLPQGSNSITAQISNLAGVVGTVIFNFSVDSVPPTISIQAPPAQTNKNTPVITISYSDAVSGVSPATLKVSLDGMDVSSYIAAGPTSATGVLQINPPLADGTHQISATVADLAGNVSTAAVLPFVVDTKPPVVTFGSPANNSFSNNPAPSIVLQYTDGTGVGVDTSSIHILLQQGSNPPSDITSDFQIGASQVTGTIPQSSSLADGTYTLKAAVNDLVGDTGTAQSTFVIDTVPPTASIFTPAANAIFNTTTVSVSVQYQDDNSGVDTSRLLLTVDGVNQTSILTSGPNQATGTLPALADGTHTIQLTIYDKAGNSSGVISQTFITDTAPPTITASFSPSPNAAGWNNADVTVSFSCSDSISGIAVCPASEVVSTEGANQIISGTAINNAGNTAVATITLNIDKSPPTITASLSSPPNAQGWNDSGVTVTFTCSDAVSGIASCPPPQTVSSQGANQTISGTATDNAGNTATTSTKVSVDTTPPTITAAASPTPNAQGWNNSDVTVVFACQDSVAGIATCPAPITVSTEGKDQQICGQAVNNAGVSAPGCTTVNIDKTAPTITAVASPAPNSNGWNTTAVTVTFTCTDSLSGLATCPSPQQVSTEGPNQVISGTATDKAGNTSAPAQVTLSVEMNPPTITAFAAPSQLSPGQSGTATLTATDDIGVTSVVFQLNGTAITTLTGPPYTATFTVPSTANAGDTLTLTAVVTDGAGLATSASRGIQVVYSGVVVGQVLSDLTGLPIPGAIVQVAGGTGQSTTDASGRYSIPSTSSHLFLTINVPANPATNTPAMVAVDREVSVQQGVGTVPVDGRMTPVAAPQSVTPSGGTVSSDSITVTVPDGAVGAATNFYLTSLSQQGIPALLPLGWSPISVFDLRSDTQPTGSLTANFTTLPSVPLSLVTYDYNVHAWMMVAPGLTVSKGALTVQLSSTGSYALVTPDPGDTAIQVPSAGQPLTGVPMVTVPTTATTSGGLSPANVAPTGGTSTASLALQSPTAIPSGTVLQAKVTETYSLTSGSKSEAPARYEDLLLYQVPAPAGAAAAATFPVTPSETFQPEQITTGDVHLDILAGRESVRGDTGGSDAVSVQNDGATLTIAAGSLPQDTAIAVGSENVDTLLPSTNTVLALAEYNIDLSGQVLSTPAQLTVPAANAQAGSTFVVALVQHVNGVPYLVAVSLAQLNGTNLVTQATSGFPGITQGGDYVFYQLNSSVGFVSGQVTATSGPIAAMVGTNGLPFVAFSNTSGNYIVPAVPGTVNLTATVPNTALAGTATVPVTAGETATASIEVSGQVETATVTPPNGSVGVPLTAEIDVTAPNAFNPLTVTSSSVLLTQNGTNTPIPVRFVFSNAGMRLSVFPEAALQSSTGYTFSASGIADSLGGLIAVPTTSFTTQATTAPSYNTDSLVFSMPDSNGNVQITAPPSSFPPGSTIQIVDETNGVVFTVTVANDGSVSGEMPATINDLLQITLTDPAGNKTTFTRSEFVAPDGTVAVGPGGGTVTGPNGTSLIIPSGALDKGATFKLGVFGQAALPDMPAVDNLQFGTGLTVQTNGVQKFNKEVKLAFPVPANAPSGAQYYVYRRVTFADGSVGYEVIDEALAQGSGSSTQVVTASPPFPGYEVVSVVNGIDTFLLTYTFDPSFPGYFTQGAITGKVLGSSYEPGSTTPVTTAVQGARVYTQKPGVVDSATRKAVFATTQVDGTYTLWDPNFVGGSITVYADNIPSSFLPANASEPYQTTAYEIQSTDSLYTLLTSGLLGKYRNVAAGNITIPPPAPPQPPPAFVVSVMQDNAGTRVATTGVVTVGSSLIIGVNPQPGSTQGVGVSGTGISVSGQSLSVGQDPQGQFAVIASYSPATPGVYTAQVTVANAFGGPAATALNTFRAIGAGGTGNTTTTSQAPAILTNQSYPTNGSTQVPVDVNPLITFSEPVTIPAGSVQLQDSSGNLISSRIAGVDNNGNAYSDITQAPAGTALTSITIQPLQNLRYSGQTNDPNGTYQIVLSQAIQDLNQPPLSLVGGSSPIIFSTYQIPTLSTGGAAFASPGIFVARDRAYVAEINANTMAYATVWQYNVSNPASPTPVAPASDGNIEGRADFVTGEDNSVEAGGKTLVAVAVAPYPLAPDAPAQTSHVMLYKGTSSSTQGDIDSLNWIGAVSLTSGASDGTVSSIAVRGNRLYAATIRKGIQVVDLDQVLSEFKSSSDPVINYGINTEGQGFATDAVIATIGVQSDPSLEYLDDLLDIKVADYPASGGQTQTLAVATGRVPSAVGSATGVSFVVVDPNAQQIVSRLMPQSAGGSLSRGVALALGSIQTATTAKNVAAVVGDGAAGNCSSCNVLTVIDMSTPASPQPLSFVALSDIPTDVVLKGNTAIVGYSDDKAELFDLTDPTNPQSLGVITGVGGKLFLYNGNELFSSGAVPGDPSSSLGGVHSAVLTPSVITNCGNSILVAPSLSGSTFQTAPPVICTVQVVPGSVPASSATFVLKQQNQAVITSSTIPLQNDVGQIQVPPGTLISGSSVVAQATAVNTLTNSPILGFPQTIPVGPVHLVVDSDNNSKLEPAKDDQARMAGKKFSFWQADQNNLGKQDGLLDYAQLQITIGAVPQPGQGRIKIQLTGAAPASWVLTKNVGVPDNTAGPNPDQLAQYLTDQTTATKQLSQDQNQSCTAEDGFSVSSYQCTSDAGGYIELVNPQPGATYNLLFSCQKCVQDSNMQLKAVLSQAGQPDVILDQLPIDIRPLQNWMTVETVRSSAGNTPLSYPTLDSGGWEDIPSAAQTLVLLVHGYGVSDEDATQQFFPMYFKRLYWAGHPVLMAQNNTQTVGFAWRGDISILGSEFPPNEFSALESGVPLATWLTDQALLYNRKIQIIAHSLGNMVVNSALMRPEALGALNQRAITSYLMNEAAIPAEAFDPNYQPDAGENAVFDQNAVTYGWSDNPAQSPIDSVWQVQWAQATAANQQEWTNTLSAAGYVTSPQPIYQLRWGQQRPSSGIPDTAPFNSTPQRGSWRGIFATNLSLPGLAIINTYNGSDSILAETWALAQIHQKPFSGALNFFSDNAMIQYWAALTNTDGGQEILWGTACSSISNCQHSNIIRQWAELAYWFPSRSDAAGTRALTLLPRSSNIDFTGYAPPPSNLPVNQIWESGPHSYLRVSPYPSVFPAWQQIATQLK